MFKRSFWPCTRLFYDTLCTYSIIVGFSLLRVCFSAYVFFVYACSTNVLVNKDWYINNAAIFVTNFQSSAGQTEGLCAREDKGVWVWQGWLVTPSVKERKKLYHKEYHISRYTASQWEGSTTVWLTISSLLAQNLTISHNGVHPHDSHEATFPLSLPTPTSAFPHLTTIRGYYPGKNLELKTPAGEF